MLTERFYTGNKTASESSRFTHLHTLGPIGLCLQIYDSFLQGAPLLSISRFVLSGAQFSVIITALRRFPHTPHHCINIYKAACYYRQMSSAQSAASESLFKSLTWQFQRYSVIIMSVCDTDTAGSEETPQIETKCSSHVVMRQ